MISIVLPADLQADLNWKEQEMLAGEANRLFWELDFGLSRGPLFLNDTAHFLSYTLAIEQFLKVFWEQYKDHTVGLCLYRGKGDFEERLVWSGELQDHFVEWGKEDKTLFCTQVFAEYMHRLASYLPDALYPFCLLDVTEVKSSAYSAQLLSKERFSHLQLAVKGSAVCLSPWIWKEEGITQDQRAIDAKIGVCLPQEEHCTAEILSILDNLFQDQKEPFRIIPEALLTEEWNNLDTLIAIDRTVSPQGRRKLLGFAAAGGEIITI
jgi:hypothetical protein